MVLRRDPDIRLQIARRLNRWIKQDCAATQMLGQPGGIKTTQRGANHGQLFWRMLLCVVQSQRYRCRG